MIQQISLLPHPFFFVRFPPESARRSSLLEGAHRRFKVATVLAGKLFDRLPLNHSSRTPCFIILRPASTRGNSVGFLSLFLSTLLSPSSPPFTMTARASSFQSSSVSTSDRCVNRPGKIAMDIITRRDVVAN